MSVPVNLESDSQALGHFGLDWIRFDDHGLVLPHSILGSLEDFRSYLKAKGETELLERIPTSQRDPPYEVQERHHYNAVECGLGMSPGHKNIQRSALDNWHRHMGQRRQQQDRLADSLNRPVKMLLMNQAMDFRDTQERREFLNQIMPLVHTGCSYHEGSEFWRLPQRIGDEISGVLTTLSRTEQGILKPIINIGQPGSLRQESGTSWGDTQRPASRTWSQSSYLRQKYDELRKVLPDKFIKKPDFSGLEVIGSNKPYTFVTPSPSPLLDKEEKKEEEHEEEKEEELDSEAQCKDSASEVLLIPALRFCGQLATWTGNTTTKEGDVGIKAIIIFEALTGERASSHLELHNEGPTAIFYSWQKVPMPHSFPNLRSQTKDLHFYFNSSSGVILPGDTQRIEFIFKSDKPGIMTEVWQLNTHPVLLQGASLQVTLRGVALFQDKTAGQRRFIQAKLEKIVTAKMCQMIVYDMLCGVRTPERPSTPMELYITEEQRFLTQNPKLQYIYQPVEDLKTLWEKVNPEQTWDLSIDTLREVVLSLPEPEPAEDTITKEKALAELNSLLLKLYEPTHLKYPRLTAADIRQQLWRTVLERMADEAVWLREMLGLPERETWFDVDESLMSDDDPPGGSSKDDKSDKKEAAGDDREERGLSRSRHRDDSKGHSMSPMSKKSGEESKRRGRRRDESGRRARDKSGKESDSLSDADQERINEQKRMARIYTPLLHTKVRALIEDMMESLCDVMDEEDQQTLGREVVEELG